MQSLYRKYRPLTFADVQGQSHIVKTLQNALASDHIGHAYLFTGPRGTGKTTMARLLATALNCTKKKKFEPCGKCENCLAIKNGSSLAVQEIDAASHTGVDNIRELRQDVIIPPPPHSRYKIYIIDEVHMLSSGAFNALLKTLEEPPTHAIFILATTEIRKVPETIISRCQRFDFSRLPTAGIIEKLMRIAKAEKITVEPGVMEMVAIAAEGGMRDAESLLSQLIALEDKKITVKEAETILGFSDRKHVSALLGHLAHADVEASFKAIQDVSNAGYDLEHFTASILHALRRLLLLRVAPRMASDFAGELTEEEATLFQELSQTVSPAWIIRATELFLIAKNTIGSSVIPQLPLEIATVKLTASDERDKKQGTSTDGGEDEKDKVQTKGLIKEDGLKPSTNAESKILKSQPKILKKTKIEKNKRVSGDSKSITLNIVQSIWPELLRRVKNEKSAIFLSASNSMPYAVSSNTIKIAAKFPLYKDTLGQKDNRLTVASILSTILETKVKIDVETEKEAGVKVTTQKAASSDDRSPLLADVLETFGDAVAT